MTRTAPIVALAALTGAAAVAAAYTYVRDQAAAATWAPPEASSEPGRRARLAIRFDESAWGRRIRRRVGGAGFMVPPHRVAAGTASVWASLLVVSSVLSLPIAVWAAASAVTTYLALQYLAMRRRKRELAFVEALPEVVRTLARVSAVPRPLPEVLALTADRVPDPAASELRLVAQHMEFGWTLGDALRELEARLPSEELALLIGVLVVAGPAGGDLPLALNGIASALETRRRAAREVRSQLSGPVATARLVGLIGALTAAGLLGALDSGDRLMASPAGKIALTAAGSLWVAGYVAIRRLVRRAMA